MWLYTFHSPPTLPSCLLPFKFITSFSLSIVVIYEQMYDNKYISSFFQSFHIVAFMPLYTLPLLPPTHLHMLLSFSLCLYYVHSYTQIPPSLGHHIQIPSSNSKLPKKIDLSSLILYPVFPFILVANTSLDKRTKWSWSTRVGCCRTQHAHWVPWTLPTTAWSIWCKA